MLTSIAARGPVLWVLWVLLVVLVLSVLLALSALSIPSALALFAWSGQPASSMRAPDAAPDAAPLPGPDAVYPLGFTPLAAGSYQLEHIQQAPNGAVLDSDGSAHRLQEFTTGKVTLFAFIYTYCTDAKGCPLAYAAMVSLRQMIAHDGALCGRVRLVSMSFDPENDTPATMRLYAGSDARPTGA